MMNQSNTETIPVDLQALTAWMDDIGLERGPLSNLQLLAGGTQNILLRFDRGGRAFVLRRPPLHLRKNSNETMKREARILEALSATDVPHPRFIAGCDDEAVLGACFYLMAPVEGLILQTDCRSFTPATLRSARAWGIPISKGWPH
jgi:aminoglycoside phosphotransferase (APT) family kinase protein